MNSILSSEDSIALRRKIKDNLKNEFDQYKLFTRHNFNSLMHDAAEANSKVSFEELSSDRSLQNQRQNSVQHSILGKRESRVEEVIEPRIVTAEPELVKRAKRDM